MSSNTIPALSVAIKHSTFSHFWVDALSVPPQGPTRLATLSSMGFIYSAASEVIISLPPDQNAVFQQMQKGNTLSESELLTLEQDAWVNSVWTYQEAVNSKTLYFVSESAMVNGMDFFNCLGQSLERYKAAHHISELELRDLMPKLNALEELLADWMVGNYAERSAFTVMSQSKYRYNTDPKNYFYAVVGSVIKGPWQWNMEFSVEQLADEFMDSCERKNDYSFIYTSNPRRKNQEGVSSWRPEAGHLKTIIVWHTWGEAQRGHSDAWGFWLENILNISPSARMNEPGELFVRKWLAHRGLNAPKLSQDDLANRTLEQLRRMEFTGSDEYFVTEHGLFYTQTSIAENATVEILVARDVRWVFGAAGIAKVKQGDTCLEYVPGVFVGKIDLELTGDVLLSA